MRDRIHDEISEALRENGFDYTVYGEKLSGPTKHLRKCASVYAVLRDNKEMNFETERLADVLAFLKTKEIYLALFPGVRTIQKAWMSGGAGHIITPEEVVVCFIRKELFQTCEETGALIQYSLKGNFLYLQEEEGILEAERSVRKMVKEFADFRRNAYDIRKIEACSAQLRVYYQQEGQNTLYSESFGRYIEDYARLGYAKKMSSAAFCLAIIRKGTE
jgi:hypothetical protein